MRTNCECKSQCQTPQRRRRRKDDKRTGKRGNDDSKWQSLLLVWIPLFFFVCVFRLHNPEFWIFPIFFLDNTANEWTERIMNKWWNNIEQENQSKELFELGIRFLLLFCLFFFISNTLKTMFESCCFAGANSNQVLGELGECTEVFRKNRKQGNKIQTKTKS